MGIFKRKSNKDKEQIRKQILKEEIDFTNIFMSVEYAQTLYDDLKVKCHPDRFFQEWEIAKATELYQLITENKTNYAMLMKLRDRANQELLMTNKDVLP